MKVHVVSFQVPYPANYGGAIDVFYKLQALKEMGFDVVLHTYVYGGLRQQPKLNEMCSEVFYYRRQTGLRKQLSLLPYIVSTRCSGQLLSDLCLDQAPILFEGLHSCYFLGHPRLARRLKIVRMHNVEHEYYRQLAHQGPRGWRTLYYLLESWRTKRYERQLRHADVLCAITQADQQYFNSRLPGQSIVHLPCFFDTSFPVAPVFTEPFVLYQGNLAVEENARVARFICTDIAPRLPGIRFVLAGRNPRLSRLPANVNLVANPDDSRLEQLLRTAQVNLLLTFQATGIKLKLINALAQGSGHIVANQAMLHGHSLGKFCHEANSTGEIVAQIEELMSRPVSPMSIQERRRFLQEMRQGASEKLGQLCQDAAAASL